MTLQRILAAGVCLLAVAASQSTSSQNWQFNVVYNPATFDCVTCESAGEVVTGAATYLCLQYPNDCPDGRQENDQSTCIGGCDDDDERNGNGNTGGGTILPPPPPPTANPTPAPTTTTPTEANETFAPTVAPPPPTPYPTPPPPDSCGILQTCNCTGQRVTATTGTMDITCAGGGFNDANSTESQTLRNVTAGDCSLSFTTVVNITTAAGTTSPETITTCYSDGNRVSAPEPEDECKDNTGVLVIIIICVLLLLVVIGIGIYYIVHTTNAHTQVPKLVANNAI